MCHMSKQPESPFPNHQSKLPKSTFPNHQADSLIPIPTVLSALHFPFLPSDHVISVLSNFSSFSTVISQVSLPYIGKVLPFSFHVNPLLVKMCKYHELFTHYWSLPSLPNDVLDYLIHHFAIWSKQWLLYSLLFVQCILNFLLERSLYTNYYYGH